jgi:fatty acid desaturase
VWRRVHNHLHHAGPNVLGDPDRRFLASEASIFTGWYTRTFYPNRRSPRWNPLVGFHYIPYIIRNTIAAFYPRAMKPAIVPAKPTYTTAQRRAICFELVMLGMLQSTVFYVAGGTWPRYFFASPIAFLVTSSVVMAYIFTNHFLNPICPYDDPLANATSVVVPHVFNLLHSNFSYHTEHHLFPNMNSEFYPLLSRLLRDHYADRYQRVSIFHAWKCLWCNEIYATAARR